MSRILILTASMEGQTRKIGEFLANALREDGHDIDVIALEDHPPIVGYDAVLVGASVHVGHYPRPLVEFLDANTDLLEDVPNGFFSVGLGALQTDEESARETAETIDAFLDELGWRPDAVTAFAGALRYTAYGPLKTLLMTRIARQEGLQTDTSQDWEYTDWIEVDAFARRFAELL